VTYLKQLVLFGIGPVVVSDVVEEEKQQFNEESDAKRKTA